MGNASPTTPPHADRTPGALSRALDLLGRRWSMRILWALHRDKKSFRELRTACDDVSPSVLNKRLKELRQAEIVTSNWGEGYFLTPIGEDLFQLLKPLGQWAEHWADRTEDPTGQAGGPAPDGGGRKSPGAAR